MNTEKTQSVRINKEMARVVKIFGVKYGGSIKSILEEGASLVMKRKLKDKYNEFYEMQSR